MGVDCRGRYAVGGGVGGAFDVGDQAGERRVFAGGTSVNHSPRRRKLIARAASGAAGSPARGSPRCPPVGRRSRRTPPWPPGLVQRFGDEQGVYEEKLRRGSEE